MAMAANGRKSTKIYIPHPNQPALSICGVLEQHAAPGQRMTGRKLALILHGALGHKDYLYQRRLAERLPFDSFRFDFRGSHETGGTWKQGALHEDLEDLIAVVSYLKANYGYEIDMIVGHSRGSLVGFRWVCTTDEGRKVSAYINISGQYRLRKILEDQGAIYWNKAFQDQGYFEWPVTVAKKQFMAKMFPHDVESYSSWDLSYIWKDFPKETDVLTIHGTEDQVAPISEAFIYTRALSDRSPGTHSLHVMENADHNFTKRNDEVVNVILDWWETRQRGALKTGIWLTEINPGTAKL